MSAPQHIGVGAPTGRLAGVREQTCRLPSKLALGSRQVGCLALGSRHVGSTAYRRWGTDRSTSWRWGADVSAPQQIVVGEPAVWRSGADLSAPQQIVVGEPTGRFPRTLPLGARHVGSLDTAFSLCNKSGAWWSPRQVEVTHFQSVQTETGVVGYFTRYFPWQVAVPVALAVA